MTIVTLPPDVEAWAKAQVQSGRFASIDEAISDAVRARTLVDDDDLSWATPLVDAARRDAAVGKTLSRAEVMKAVAEVIERRHDD